MATLASIVRLGRGRFTLAFALYERSAQRPGLIARLHLALPELRWVELSLQDSALDLRNLSSGFFHNLRQIADRNAGGGTVDAVLLLDWEQRLATDGAEAAPAGSSLLSVFNLGRKLLKDVFPCPLIVVTPHDAYRKIFRFAADFASWQSGTFLFPAAEVEPEGELCAAVAAVPGPAVGDAG